MVRMSQKAHDLHKSRKSVKAVKDSGGREKCGIMASDVLVMCLHRV